VKEDVAASVKDNFVRYHLTDDDSEITVIDDFNRVSLYISLILTLTAYCIVITTVNTDVFQLLYFKYILPPPKSAIGNVCNYD